MIGGMDPQQPGAAQRSHRWAARALKVRTGPDAIAQLQARGFARHATSRGYVIAGCSISAAQPSVQESAEAMKEWASHPASSGEPFPIVLKDTTSQKCRPLSHSQVLATSECSYQTRCARHPKCSFRTLCMYDSVSQCLVVLKINAHDLSDVLAEGVADHVMPKQYKQRRPSDDHWRVGKHTTFP